MIQFSLQGRLFLKTGLNNSGVTIMNKLLNKSRFERCPNCGSVVQFKDSDQSICPRCKVKIRLKK